MRIIEIITIKAKDYRYEAKQAAVACEGYAQAKRNATGTHQSGNQARKIMSLIW